ncbi:MAG: glycosyltransferase family 2 protein [Maritimibacter sp.]
MDLQAGWQAYKLRVKRRRLMWRSFRSRHQLTCLNDRSAGLADDAILAFTTIRNEAHRLPYFLSHYRALGVSHFFFVDNMSSDGSAEMLAGEPDVSIWQTGASYKASRFGMDWLGWLLMHYGRRHWCLTVDADEILVFPHYPARDLRDLTLWLDAQSIPAFGALMLDMYPKGPLGEVPYQAGDDPFDTLCWFDNGPWTIRRQRPMQNLWLQGGVRERAFFAKNPRRGPTLNKLPLIRWNLRYSYVNSTHSMLPSRLNNAYEGPGGPGPSGVLLHSKFLDTVVERSREEQARGEHFNNPDLFNGYYDWLANNPQLWTPSSERYEGPDQLEKLGLMTRGDWV